MLTQERNEWLFASGSKDKDVAIVEGVMGLFDGFDGSSERGSTAEMAKWLGLPVILVVDAHAMARSAAALIHGFKTFDPEVKIAGVIFNRVAGEGHYRMLADAVTDVPILGWLPMNPTIEIPERHLGLFTAKEEQVVSRIQAIGEFISRHVNIERLMSVAVAYEGAKTLDASVIPLLASPQGGVAERSSNVAKHPLTARGIIMPEPNFSQSLYDSKTKRVALAHDKAFSFYYQSNWMALEEAGAEIIEFSPLADSEIPDADLLYIGGGYQELYRNELEANRSMRSAIKRFIESGRGSMPSVEV